MIKLFVKKFIKNHEDVKDNKVREKYGILAGILGIICNLVLFAVKFIWNKLVCLYSFILNKIKEKRESAKEKKQIKIEEETQEDETKE